MRHIDRKEHPELWAIANRCGYTGHDLRVTAFVGPMSLNSYWDSGCRDYYSFYSLETKQVVTVAQNGTMFDGKDYGISDLPPSTVLVNRYSGRHDYCALYVRYDEIAKMLPAPTEQLSADESIVLGYTCRYKSSYAGVSNFRYHKAKRDKGITLERWEAAKLACVARGFLNKAGAITPKGRNYAGEPGTSPD